MRVLITVAPLMYREALALTLHNRRPDIDVLLASEATLDGQVDDFAPQLLVRNDTDGADMDKLANVPCWIEILYSDGMDARVSLDGEVWEITNISMDDLMGIIERLEGSVPTDTQEE